MLLYCLETESEILFSDICIYQHLFPGWKYFLQMFSTYRRKKKTKIASYGLGMAGGFVIDLMQFCNKEKILLYLAMISDMFLNFLEERAVQDEEGDL